MKKYFILLGIITCVLLNTLNSASAKEMKKFFNAYQVKNVNIREFGVLARNAITSGANPDRAVALKNIENAYIYTDEECSYFIKLYPANQHTNIFIVSDEKYDLDNNDVTKNLQKQKFKYCKLNDKKALKEYQNDFYTYARQQKLGNFYISPDLAKPVKKCITYLNKKMTKYTKNATSAYSVDNEPINLTCIDTISHYDNDAKISIIRKEYRLKEKTNNYIHAFEYVLTNKNTSTATVTATSEKTINLVDVNADAMANVDRLDLMDYSCSFPPVFICTCGLSLVGSVPNWVRYGKITKEATRYTHALPKDYKLNSQGNMRVLVLKYKENPAPLNFDIKFDNQTYNIKF